MARATVADLDNPRLKDLLEQGESILRGRELAEEQVRQKERQRRQADWHGLLAYARRRLGEALGDQPADPPDSFKGNDFTFVLRPFASGEIHSRWFATDVDADGRPVWEPVILEGANRHEAKLFWVATAYALDAGYGVAVKESAYTDSLAEAVALCRRATASYLAAQEELKTLTEPDKSGVIPDDKTTETKPAGKKSKG